MSIALRLVASVFLLATVACTQAPSMPSTNASATPVAAVPQVTSNDAALVRRKWTVNDEERVALIYAPADATKTDTPVVFAFHGHGGSARQASRSFHIHTEWPEAIVVYMEGLPTPGTLVDRDGKMNGWQSHEGMQDDRDLKFFDAVLATLKTDYHVDERRIYAMGHSNGGGFTYLLWSARGDVFAAMAPSGAFTRSRLAPKPVMHIAGKNDDLVKFQWQERMMASLKKLDGCAAQGESWAKDCTLYPSTTGTPVITMIYDGDHTYPSDDAPPLIVKFFKEQAKPAEPKQDDPNGK